ncbi:MAG: hypothetical protein U9R50_02840 [Campylobacterota bacterium]|nr:hypothetical protein [Campylobacterota bacterium]
MCTLREDEIFEEHRIYKNIKGSLTYIITNDNKVFKYISSNYEDGLNTLENSSYDSLVEAILETREINYYLKNTNSEILKQDLIDANLRIS